MHSIDNGDNWTKKNNSPTTKGISLIIYNLKGDIFISTRDGIYRSTDGGENWTKTNNGLTTTYIECLTINSNGHIFAGTSIGVFFSTDNGDSWIKINNGLTDLGIRRLVINSDGYIYTGTRDGLFRSINSTVSVEKENIVPSEYALEQNYPNPFNPSTTIKYQILSNVKGEMSNVKLLVYDVLGREIATLVNKEQKAGYYEVKWNAENNSSGIYFYRIQVFSASGGGNTSTSSGQSFVETKKMILLR